jgi:hypothetical protein
LLGVDGSRNHRRNATELVVELIGGSTHGNEISHSIKINAATKGKMAGFQTQNSLPWPPSPKCPTGAMSDARCSESIPCQEDARQYQLTRDSGAGDRVWKGEPQNLANRGIAGRGIPRDRLKRPDNESKTASNWT